MPEGASFMACSVTSGHVTVTMGFPRKAAPPLDISSPVQFVMILHVTQLSLEASY
jgi:hypothetical protein